MRAFVLILVVCITSIFAVQLSDKVVQEKVKTDFIPNTFGLQSIQNLTAQFQAILTQFILAVQDKWNQTEALINDAIFKMAFPIGILTNHIGDASIVTQTVQVLSAFLQKNNSGKRGLADYCNNLPNHGQMQNLQFIPKPTVQELATEAQKFLGNSFTGLFLKSFGFGSIWDKVQNVNEVLLGQFTNKVYQLVFSGAQVIAQSTPILQQLTSDLQNHLGNTSTILTDAVAQLAQILPSNSSAIVYCLDSNDWIGK